MRYIKIFIITLVALILTACSQNFKKYSEPSGPPRDYEDLTYFTDDITDITSIVEDEIPEGLEGYSRLFEKYQEIQFKKFEEIYENNENPNPFDALQLSTIEAEKIFEDKGLYTNIKLSYLEDNPQLFNKSLVAFKGTIEDLAYDDFENLSEQITDIFIRDDSVEKAVKVEILPMESTLSSVIVHNRMDKLEKLGPLYRGDKVIVYGYIDDITDVFTDSHIFRGAIKAHIIELVE